VNSAGNHAPARNRRPRGGRSRRPPTKRVS
jgi:hypothetical protein